jgi:hypothetical protein
MVGNSLKYTTTNSNTLNSNTLWKHYQNKNNNKTTSTPAHLILAPSDSDKVLNFMKFSDLGTDNLKDSATFKKIQTFSKSNPQKLYSNVDEFNLKYKKLSDLYLNDYEPLTANSYGLKRQHNFVSQKSLLNNSSSLMDKKGLDMMMKYNHDVQPSSQSTLSTNALKYHNHPNSLNTTPVSASINTKLNSLTDNKNNLSLSSYLAFLEKNSLLSAENDSPQVSNPLKYALNSKWNKKSFLNSKWINTSLVDHEITALSPISNFSTKLLNEEVSPRFKDLKSAGTSFLPSERNSRLLNNLNSTKSNMNYSGNGNTLTTLVTSSNASSSQNLQEVLFDSSNTQWSNSDTTSRLLGSSTTAPISHTPITNNSSSNYALSFDKFLQNQDDLTPNLLTSKEESAPNHVFNTY